MARGPQPPIPQIFGPPAAPPSVGFLASLAAAGLFILTALGTIVKEIGARWRGIVIAHLFFLTLWMAVQVFFFTTGAYWCLPGNSSAAARWFTKYFTHIAQCGPALSAGVALAAPAPHTAALAPAAPPAPAPAPAPAAAAPAAPAPAAPAAPAAAPSRATHGAPPPGANATGVGTASNWSAREVQNCWRDRSVDNGMCYEPRPRPAAPPPVRRHYVPPPPVYHRCHECWAEGFRDAPWRYDY